MKTTILAALLVLVSTFASAQIMRCESGATYWVLTQNDSVHYVMRTLMPVKQMQRPNIVQAGEFVVQAVTVAKAPYIGGADTSQLAMLSRYATEEGDFISKQMKTKLELTMVKSNFGEGQGVDVLIWSHVIPETITKEVKAQIFANIILGDRIFGVSSPQFSDQTYEAVRDFLMDMISTVKVVRNQAELGTLCD